MTSPISQGSNLNPPLPTGKADNSAALASQSDILSRLPVEAFIQISKHLPNSEIRKALRCNKVVYKSYVDKSKNFMITTIIKLAKQFISRDQDEASDELNQVIRNLSSLEITTINKLGLLDLYANAFLEYSYRDKEQPFYKFKILKLAELIYDGKIDEALSGIEQIAKIEENQPQLAVATLGNFSFKDEALSEFIPIIAIRYDPNLVLHLADQIENMDLQAETKQKICLILARSNHDKALEIAKNMNFLRDETIYRICILTAKKDINLSVQIFNKELGPQHKFSSHFYLEITKMLYASLKMLAASLKDSPDEEIFREVENFINYYSYLLKKHPRIFSTYHVLVKRAYYELAEINIKLSIYFILRTELEPERFMIIKNIFNHCFDRIDNKTPTSVLNLLNNFVELLKEHKYEKTDDFISLASRAISPSRYYS